MNFLRKSNEIHGTIGESNMKIDVKWKRAFDGT